MKMTTVTVTGTSNEGDEDDDDAIDSVRWEERNEEGLLNWSGITTTWIK